MIKPRTHSTRGFTLIEIMLALLVITVGIVSIIGVLSSSIDTSAKSRQDIQIVTFADLVLNYGHAAGYEAIPATGGLTLIDEEGDRVTLPYDTVSTYTASLPGTGTEPQEFTLSYRLRVSAKDDTKALYLEVWPGPNTEAADPQHFYTEIFNWEHAP